MIEVNEKDIPFTRPPCHTWPISGAISRIWPGRRALAIPRLFARKWHILMKGSIMAAHEGDAAAARRAREIGELLLQSF